MREPQIVRRLPGAATALAVLAMTGCKISPAQNVLGSYFPSWMLCVFVGIAVALVTRMGLVLAGIDKVLPAPLVVYLAFAVLFSFAAWILWLG